MTHGGLCMTPRDYARFAYLILRKGRWQDQQIVDPEWIERTRTAPWYQNMRSNVDGYFGRELPADMVRMFGSGGNFAAVLEGYDLLVAAHFELLHRSRTELGLEKFRMGAKGVGQTRTRAVDDAGVVFHPAGGQYLPAGAAFFQHKSVKTGALAVDGGGKSRRASADDDQFTFFHEKILVFGNMVRACAAMTATHALPPHTDGKRVGECAMAYRPPPDRRGAHAEEYMIVSYVDGSKMCACTHAGMEK